MKSRVVLVLGLAAASVSPSRSPMHTLAPASVLDQFDFRPKAAVHVKLPKALHEISGLAVTPDGRVFAHADEHGVVMQVDPCHGAIEKTFSLGRPALRDDFEGIAIVGERFFLITSTGRLYETREGANGAAVPFTVLDTGYGKTCEIEGLAYEPADRALLMGCKRSPHPSLRGRALILRWSLDRRASAAPASLTIALSDIAGRSGVKGFHTTSIERDAQSGHYVLVAGPERLLAEVTTTGAVVATRNLRREFHPQPEGVTFLGDSVLFIADEGGAHAAAMTCYHRVR